MLSATILKVAAQNIYETALDTDDLSTIRGSSLTLAKMPELVLQRLRSLDGIDVTVIQAAASELVVGLRTPRTGLNLTPERLLKGGQVEGVKVSQFNRQAQSAASTLSKDLSEGFEGRLLQAAGKVCIDAKLTDDAHETVARHILSFITEKQRAELAGGTPVPLSPAAMDAILCDLSGFLSDKQDGWPFDLFIFSLAWRTPPAREKFHQTLGHIESDLRQQQLQKLNCAMPSVEPGNGEFCGLSLVQPASTEPEHVKKGTPLSRSVWRRREIGRKAKQSFYREILQNALELLTDLPQEIADALPADTVTVVETGLQHLDAALKEGFAEDFAEIVEAPPEGVSKSVKANFAVFSMDGNGFGKIRSGIIDSGGAASLAVFSRWLEIRKARFLARVLIWIAENKAEMIIAAGEAAGRAKFEALLWGGDEYVLVVPSWAAWSFIELLEQELADWAVPGDAGQMMTFACGLAIAKSKSPIRATRNAADTLVDLAKPRPREEATNRIEICVYEGIDSLTMNPELYRASVFELDSEVDYAGELAITLDGFTRAVGEYGELQDAFGRSGVMRLLGQPGLDLAALKRHESRVGGGAEARVYALESAADNRLLGLRQTLLLWDYARAIQKVS